jgi:hypothetical protein
VASLLLGAVAPTVRAANLALAGMGPAGAAAASGISLLGRAVGGITLAAPVTLGLNLALGKLFDTAASSEELEELARQLDMFAGASDRAQAIMLRGDLGGEFDRLNEAIRRVTAPGNLDRANDFLLNFTSLSGLISKSGTDLADAKKDIEGFNDAIVEMAKLDPTAAGQAYAAVLRQLVIDGIPPRDAMEQLGDARRAVFEGNLAAGGVTDPIGEIEDAAAAAEQAASDLKTGLDELFLGAVSNRQAADEVATRARPMSSR